ncbi:MAG TPA: glutamate synthase subunit beta [Blastocatellia bacterium]
MGKPTGFIEYGRDLPIARLPKERVSDWLEFHGHQHEDDLRTQGARCMDCGVPFCHTGKLINGMASGCPINNLIPEWNDLVYQGRWRDALHSLLKTNNFPEFTGRVCPAPCEASCVLGISEDPVTIKNIECSIIDRAFDEGWIRPAAPIKRTGKHVAVIGSGPAGLACAAQLNAAGHQVTVFERDDRIGGLLMYGIPNMKLDKQIVQRRVDLMAAEGVRFVTRAKVGFDYSSERLMREHDAVVLCGGATKARDLPIEGRNLSGIHFAMEFLRANTKSLLDSNHQDGNYLSARGKDVIVIGGGDTGTDCVGTALRHGCRSLVQFEILPKPPDERAPDNPWPQWPKVYKMDYGQEEAAALFGHDPRSFSIMSKKFIGDGQGNLEAILTVDIEWVRGESGRIEPRELADSERVWPARMALLSMGFAGPEKEGLLEQLGVALDQRGNVAVDSEMMTGSRGIFSAGDMQRGQSLVVWAIADGRRAARGVDKFLMGSTILP